MKFDLKVIYIIFLGPRRLKTILTLEHSLLIMETKNVTSDHATDETHLDFEKSKKN